VNTNRAENPWLHRYAVLVAACTSLLFINGPAVTSNEARPLYTLGQSHVWLGVVVSILMAGLAVWLSRSKPFGHKKEAWLRHLVWIALGVNIVQDLLGLVTDPQPAAVRISHSLIGQLFFSMTAAIAVFTSGARNQSPKPVENGSLLRFLAAATLALVLLQVFLGAAFRHGVMGLLPHMLWALVVGLFLGLAMAAILRTELPELRPAGIALAVVASLQILLGFALFTMQAIDADPFTLIVATTAHAAVGALTLAAAVVMAIVVRRVIRVDAAHETLPSQRESRK